MAKRFKAAIIGGSGYGGAELIRRLLHHPEIELVRVASVDFIGEPLSVVHPNLERETELVFEGITPGEAAKGMDVVLLGLPHKVSAQKMPELMATGTRVVDLSGDFRLHDAAVYKKYYGADHPCPDKLDGTFVYGLPELNREAIKKARYVASPGCFATTIELALLPLARAGLLEGEIAIVGITGSSGSGIAPSAGTHHPVRHHNLRTYKPLDHQHVPEIQETLASAGAKKFTLRFVPVSAPLSRGIFATSFVHVPEKTTPDEIRALYMRAYAKEPFVRVPQKRLPEVVAVAGSNFCEVGVQPAGTAEDGKRTVACFSVTDNLIKGGAGQAIQSMNLMLGLDERLTLEDPRGLSVSPAAEQADRSRSLASSDGSAALEPIVLEIGGEVVAGPHMAAIAADVAEMRTRSLSVVLVHGGGPQATDLQKKLGQTPKIVAGRRITDQDTLEVMKMIVAGKVNVDLCAALLAAGASPVGLHGASSGAVRAVKRPPRVVAGGGPDAIDFGHVGDVTGVNEKLLALLAGAGFVPVLACLGADENGAVYNINADVVANRVAIALEARALVVISDVPGVLRDLADPSSRIPRLTIADGKRAIAEGVVTKGMIPKLEESFAALLEGVRAVHIVGRLERGQLAREVAEPGSVGTVLVK